VCVATMHNGALGTFRFETPFGVGVIAWASIGTGIAGLLCRVTLGSNLNASRNLGACWLVRLSMIHMHA
jgi:hypothetical protein